jgi:hypothetical protein
MKDKEDYKFELCKEEKGEALMIEALGSNRAEPMENNKEVCLWLKKMSKDTYIFNYPFYYRKNEKYDNYDVINCDRPIINNIRFIKDHVNSDNELLHNNGHYIFDLVYIDDAGVTAPETHHIKHTNYFIKNTKKNLKLLIQIDSAKKKQIIAERDLDRFNYQTQE